MGSRKSIGSRYKKHRRAVKRRQAWDRFGTDVQTTSAGVATIATLVAGVSAVINSRSKNTPREIDRTDQLVALSMDAQKAVDGSYSRSQRRQARKTKKAADRALESLAARRASAEADYAVAVHEGMAMHRAVPRPVPAWWPEGADR